MPRIPDETIEQIAAANDIVEVIGGYIPLKRAGSNFRGLCPFHQEKTPSFNVNPSRQSYHCFGCGAGGSVFTFVMNYENIDFPSAARKLAERGNITIVEAEFSAEEGERSRMKRRLLDLHYQAAEWFHQNLLKSQSAKAGRDYLKSRGLTSDVAKSWKIGYAPDSWDAFSRWGHAQGFNDEEIIASGLVSLKDNEGRVEEDQETGYRSPQFYDRFRDRVMFPICNDRNEVIGFSGRVLQSDAKTAKYVNSPTTPLFVKGNVLFGIHKTKRALLDKGSAVVCEGQIDLISVYEAGIKNVIASQGTAFTKEQAHILKRHVDEVVLCFDSDTAGQSATEKTLVSLLAENIMVRVAEMPQGHDPDSLIRNLGAEAFVTQIEKAKDFFDYQIDRFAATPEFTTARGKTQFARKMAGWASLITDSALREAVGNKISTRIEFSGAEFVKMLKEPPKEESAAPTTPEADLIQTEPLITNLIYVAVRNAEARAWLLQRDWKRILENEPNAELLVKALAHNLKPDDNSSINSWLTTLSPSEEATLRRILERGMLPMGKPSKNDAVVARPEDVTGVLWHPMKTAQDAWLSLERGQITRQITAIAARLRTPDLPFEEIIKLQKETLDLRRELTDIARPFSSNND